MDLKLLTDVKKLPGWFKASEAQIRAAAVQAVNDTGFKVRQDLQRDMRQNFDRVTPYIVGSVRVDPATEAKPEVVVAPTFKAGQGVEPQKILRAEVFGGTRHLKRSEVLLSKAGILPTGCYTVPGTGAAGLLDQYGNLKGTFITQLLAYLGTFGQGGRRANLTDKRKAKLAARSRSASGQIVIEGVEYFLADGTGAGALAKLHPGIWSRTGLNGRVLKPILMFVRGASYKRRLDFDKLADPAQLQAQYLKNLRYRLGRAVK